MTWSGLCLEKVLEADGCGEWIQVEGNVAGGQNTQGITVKVQVEREMGASAGQQQWE